MPFKTLPVPPLETIYEESGSFVESKASSQYELEAQTVNGLIHARSIPAIEVERQRSNENHKKPPIEVLFRNGTKRVIHPSSTSTLIMNGRNLFSSSSSSPAQDNFLLQKKIRTKPLVITIITAEDLRRAGVTSTTTPSSSGSDPSYSQTTSPFIQVKSLEDFNGALSKQSSTVSLFVNSPQNFPPKRNPHSIPPVSIRTIPTHHENDQNLTFNSVLSERTANPIVSSQPITTIIQTNTSSAFRPVFKPIPISLQPVPTKPREPSILPANPIQQQQTIPQPKHYQPNITFVSYHPTHRQKSLISTEKGIQITSNLRSLLRTNHPPPPPSYSTPPNPSFSTSPWHTVTSNSFYDIPRLSSTYYRVPLRITLPVSHVRNQNLVIKHNPVLEQRLLNAGLSPETVALYERVLDVAANRQLKL